MLPCLRFFLQKVGFLAALAVGSWIPARAGMTAVFVAKYKKSLQPFG
jgi:hypothetical protein